MKLTADRKIAVNKLSGIPALGAVLGACRCRGTAQLAPEIRRKVLHLQQCLATLLAPVAHGRGGNLCNTDRRRGAEMRVRRNAKHQVEACAMLLLGIASAVAMTLAGCASNSAQANAYNTFLNTIAAQCKPLIIGSDNLGQAIELNGLGATPENYNNFLGKTSALYYGSMPPAIYRESLTAFLGAGTYNQRSFDCIVAHLPVAAK